MINDQSAAPPSDAVAAPDDIPSRLVVVRPEPLNAEAPAAALTRVLTATSDVYVRSNFGLPPLAAAAHHIEVGGTVRQPFTIGVDELRQLAHRSLTMTMECAGNDRATMRPLPTGEPWRSGALSTARWSGVPLSMLLERARLAPESREILIEGADGGTREDAEGHVTFGRSLPLDVARSPDTLLALDMNGEPLPAHHGAPVRLIVPGWYGMASVKWVVRITALAEPFSGYFQRQRYVYDRGDGEIAPVTRMRVKSVVTAPDDGARIPPGRTRIRGWAWSGDAEIARVEVAVGGGDGWRDARLGEPAARHAWTPWEIEWDIRTPGRSAIRSRATDRAGNVQPDEAPWNRLGYGNNAVRPILVDVG